MANARATFREGYWYASITNHQGRMRHIRTRAQTRGEAERMAVAFQQREDLAREELLARAAQEALRG